MSKKLQLTIPVPCHEDWDAMTPVEKGRFCSSCQKQVVDFSRMSDREVAQFFKKPSTGSVCGRFLEDQLDRDIDIPKKRIPWVKYFFQFALPAFMLTTRATAQGKPVMKVKEKTVDTVKCTKTTGTIAIVKAEPVKPAVEAGMVSQIIIVGESKIVNELLKPQKSVLDDTVTLPEVIIAAYPHTVKGRLGERGWANKNESDNDSTIIAAGRSSKDSLLTRVFNGLKATHHKIFPNPVKPGSSLHIEWNQEEAGSYQLQLLNQSGQLVFSKEMWVDAEARLLELQLPSVARGNYFLRMTHRGSGKGITEKIVVE